MQQSSAMHWLDRLATAVIRRPGLYPRLFPDGWGDGARLEMLMETIASPDPGPATITPVFDDTVDGGHRLGTFTSSCEVLPERCRPGRVLHVSPRHRRQVVLLAASNDHSFATRLRVAEFLDTFSVGSVILEHAFYGRRRKQGDGQPVRTVVDFLEMTIASPLEGVGLVRWLAAEGASPGVAGFSMGGSHAAVVGALCPIPLAVAPMAASYSSSPVFTEGVLCDSVDWTALGGRESGLPRLREVLLNLDITALPAPSHTSSAVFGIGRGDGYVPERFIMPIVEHWDGAEPVYINPGHAGFHLWGKRVQAQLIARSFDRLERAALQRRSG